MNARLIAIWRQGLAAALGVVAGAPAETLHLDADRAVRLAVEASPLIRAADARIDGSSLAVDAADAARLPEISALSRVARRSAVPELSAAIGGPGSSPVTIFPNIENTALLDLAISQPLYAGGAIAGGREEARRQLESARSSREVTAAELRVAARVDYWRAVAGMAAVEAAEAQERRARCLVEDAQALRQAGMAVDADVLAAEARAAASRVEVIRVRTAAREVINRLRSLLGIDPATVLELADARTTLVPSGPEPLAALLATAARGRGELLSIDARTAALGARERVVDAGRRPSLFLAAQWDLARPNPRYLPMEDSWNDSWSVGVVAGWKLFDAGRTRAEAATVGAERETSRAERDELWRQVSLEVETARLELAAALEAVPAADASHTAAVAREEASRERYNAGLSPIQETLDAQADLTDAEVTRIRTRAAAWIAAAALARATGQ